MKIIILGTRGFPNIQGGVEKHCECLAASLVKLGCEVIVLTRMPYVDKSLTEFKGVKLVALPAIRSKFFEAFFHTLIGVFVARCYNPDILHIQSIGPSFFALLARLLGMKVIVTTHGPNYKHLKWGGISRKIIRLFEYFGINFSNKVIAISKIIADEIKMEYNRNSAIIPNGVEIPQLAKSEVALRKYGLEKGRYILAVGRFVPEKGFSDLLESWELGHGSLANSADAKLIVHDYKLVIVGEADHEDSYSKRLKAKGKGNSVILTGRLTGEPLAQLYSYAGIFVLPSYYEGLPIVLLEAMSYGLSCIVSDIPANREFGLEENRYFKAGDIKGMAAKIHEYTLKSLDEKECEKQIEMVREKYNWENIAKQTLAVYKSVLNAK